MSDRIKLLDGSHNVRDLGGLPTQHGLRVRRDVMYRSDYPGFAELDQGRAVHELGLRSVVDLRRGSEAAQESVDWEGLGVVYHRWPIVAGGESSWHAGYPSYLEHKPESVVGAVRSVLDVSAHPVLFHCAAGKDRTGVVAALVLSVLGVADADIVADYVLSDGSVEAVLARLMEIEPYRAMLSATTLEEQRPRAQAVEDLLAVLHARGGAERWLVDHGLGADEIDTARRVLLA